MLPVSLNTLQVKSNILNPTFQVSLASVKIQLYYYLDRLRFFHVQQKLLRIIQKSASARLALQHMHRVKNEPHEF